jgi:hypothetical protein
MQPAGKRRIYRQHADPAWKGRANFIIQAKVDDSDEQEIWEELFCRRIDETRLQVCCIPFFLRGVALGDEVEMRSESGSFVFSKVLVPAGHETYQIWFGENPEKSVRMGADSRVQEIGGLVEYFSRRLIAVDAYPEAIAKSLRSYLDDMQRDKALFYQIG